MLWIFICIQVKGRRPWFVNISIILSTLRNWAVTAVFAIATSLYNISTWLKHRVIWVIISTFYTRFHVISIVRNAIIYSLLYIYSSYVCIQLFIFRVITGACHCDNIVRLIIIHRVVSILFSSHFYVEFYEQSCLEQWSKLYYLQDFNRSRTIGRLQLCAAY